MNVWQIQVHGLNMLRNEDVCPRMKENSALIQIVPVDAAGNSGCINHGRGRCSLTQMQEHPTREDGMHHSLKTVKTCREYCAFDHSVVNGVRAEQGCVAVLSNGIIDCERMGQVSYT